MNPSDPKGPSAQMDVSPTRIAQKDPFKKWVRFLVFLIILILLGLAAYFYPFKAPLDSVTERPDEGFTSSTEVNGTACTRTICSNVNTSQCVVLSGGVQKDGACKLNEKQQNKNAQGLYDILIRNAGPLPATEK